MSLNEEIDSIEEETLSIRDGRHINDINSLSVSGLLEHFGVGRVSEAETITLGIGNLEERVLQLRVSLEES